MPLTRRTNGAGMQRLLAHRMVVRLVSGCPSWRVAEDELATVSFRPADRLVLQRQLAECVASAFVVAEAGLVLSSAAPA